MPGLAGVIGAADTGDPPPLPNAMLRRMKHHPWYVEERHVSRDPDVALGRISLGFVNAAGQPAFNEDGSLLAVMEGEVYNYDEERRALAAAGHVFRSDSQAELLLH